MSPHEYMTKLDKEGKTYQLEYLTYNGNVSDGNYTSDCEILSHNATWIFVQGGGSKFFINMKNIDTISIRVL